MVQMREGAGWSLQVACDGEEDMDMGTVSELMGHTGGFCCICISVSLFFLFSEEIFILLSETFKLKSFIHYFWKENAFLRTMKNSEF